MDDVKLTLVDNLEEVDNFRRWMGERRPNNWLGLDTETTGFEFWRPGPFVRMIQIGDAQHGWAIPTELWKGLAKWAINSWEGDWVMHNSKFDVLALRADGINVPWHKVHDTMIFAALVDPDKPKGLKPLASKWISPTALQGAEMLDKVMSKNGWDWDTVPYDCPPYWIYSGLDPVLTVKMADKLWSKVQYARRAYDVEMGAIAVLANMEWKGVHVDVDFCRRTQTKWDAEVLDKRLECQQRWGVMNPTSNHQVYTKLQEDGVQLVKLTPTGQPQLTEEILDSIDHPLAKMVLRIRKLTKMTTTYLQSFMDLADSDGLIHAGINPVAARTGRMSITRPPLQTLPRSFEIRDAFIPTEGNLLVLSDFDQVELRVMASYAQETSMIEAFRRGDDLHTWVAQQVFNTQTPTKPQRQIAKNAAFAKIYGAGIAKFAMTAKISEDESRTFLQRYDQLFPNVVVFQSDVMQQVMMRQRKEGTGFITTFGGRRLPIPKGKEYVGVNYLIQGSCADVLKMKLCELDAAGVGDLMVLPVHDEVVLDVPRDDVDEVREIVKKTMQELHWFDAPLTVSVEVAERWGEKYPELL